MTDRTRLSFLFLLLTGCTSLRGSFDGQYSSAIIGGSVERGYSGVGALLDDEDPFCTATLISSTVAITAAHCLEGVRTADLSFFVGVDANDLSSGLQVGAQSLHIHPDYDARELTNDIGIVVLEDAVDADIMPILQDDMDDTWVGLEALFIGFGWAPEDAYGVKHSVRIPISYVYSDAFEYESADLNTCNGDSGGPALYKVDGQMTLIGITSYGDPDCEVYGVNSRVDPYLDFILPFLSDDTSSTESSPDETVSSGGTRWESEEDVFGLANHSPEGRAILYLVNDLDQSELDDDVRLDRRAAEGIIAHREGPDGVLNTEDDAVFSTLMELDAIYYVGPSAFGKLLDYADQTGVLAAYWFTHGIEEYSAEASAVLSLASSMSESGLDERVGLDSRAAANIVAYRAGADGIEGTEDDQGLRFLYDLDGISYVGQTAFEKLSSYAAALGMH